jgi:hypothetical protein
MSTDSDQPPKPDLNFVSTDELIEALRLRFQSPGGFIFVGEWEDEEGRHYRQHFEGGWSMVFGMLHTTKIRVTQMHRKQRRENGEDV